MMFFKKKSFGSLVQTDFHSHLIHGIDDGAKNIQSALDLARELSLLGYKKLITTPHIKKGQYDNTIDMINQGLKNLQEIIKQNNLDIQVATAAEYYYDETFLQAIKEDNLLHINRFVLFEFSYITPPVNLEDTIYELKLRDYIPVLAHPERYLYYHTKLERYEYLKNLGIHFQLNLNSLVGYYSKPVEKVATYLSKRGFIDFVGSDAHHFKHTDTLGKVFESSAYKTLFKNNEILNDILLEGLM